MKGHHVSFFYGVTRFAAYWRMVLVIYRTLRHRLGVPLSVSVP